MSDARLVKTTALAGLRPLGGQGQPAIYSYRQLAAVIERRLGPEHAALFAWPERRADGGIDWFTQRPGAIRSIGALDPAERGSLEAAVARAQREIASLAGELGAGG